MIAVFGACSVDLDRVEVRRDGALVDTQPQVFAVLAYLLAHTDRVVSKEELLDNVWGDRFVSESALTSRIKSLRRALGDDGVSQHTIKTVHGRGFRFIREVAWDGQRAGGRRSTDAAASVSTVAPANAARPRHRGDSDAVWSLVGRSTIVHEALEVLQERTSGDVVSGVIIAGPDRSGRTKVLAEVGRELRDLGMRTESVHGSIGLSQIPLAAIDHLLGDDVALFERGGVEGAPSELAQAAAVRRAVSSVRASLAGVHTTIIVDDVDRLDDLSSAVLASLAASADITVVLAIRSATADNQVWSGLVASGRLHRVDLPALDAVDVDALLHRRLGGPLDLESLERLVEISEGLPGLLVDVVENTLGAGALAEHGGVWRLVGLPRTAASVAWPLPGLSRSAVAAAENMALLGVVPMELAPSLLGDDELDELDRERLVTVVSGLEPVLRLTDELLTAKIVEAIPPLRARRCRADLVERLLELPPSPTVLAAVANWEGHPLTMWDPPVVVETAFSALMSGDVPAAAAIVEAAQDRIDPVAVIIAAEVAVWRGQLDVADDLLSDVDTERLDAGAASLALRRRASLAFVHRGRHDDAIGLLSETSALPDADVGGVLAARHATLLAASQRYADLDGLRPRLERIDGVAASEAQVAIAFGLAGQGRSLECLDVLDGVERLLPGLSPMWKQEVSDSMAVLVCSSMQQLGRLDEAAAAARRILPSGKITRLGFAPAVAADIELAAGRPRAAREVLRPARTGVIRRSFPQYRPMIDAISARTELALGHREEATRLVDDAAASIDLATGAVRSRALVWIAEAKMGLGVAVGDIGLEAIADRAAELGSALGEMETRCLLVALDETAATAKRFVARIEAVAGKFDGELWPIRVAAVKARAEGRSTRRFEDAFARLGYVHLAERVRSGR
ncbi:MAG: winged helix-turn-helix domain-containing protein [Ilumatobacter sp.]